MMRKGLLVLCVLVGWISVNAQSVKIENEYLTLQVNQKRVDLKSKELQDLYVRSFLVDESILNFTRSEVVDSQWGKGVQVEVEYENGRQMTYRLYEHNPFLHIHTSIVNQRDRDLQIRDLFVTTVEVGLENQNKPLNTIGSGGFTPASMAQGSFGYSLVTEPESRHSLLVAWLTQKQGLGLVTPKQDLSRKVYRVRSSLEFGNYLVKKGERRGTDIMIVGFFTDGRQGLELYGEHLAKAYNIVLPERPEVYCTWYHRDRTGSGASTEKALLENAEFARKELAPFGLNVFQIDDHWQSSMVEGIDYKNQAAFAQQRKIGDGPLKSFKGENFNFPSGMAATVDNMTKNGFVSGLWFMPFAGDVRNPVFKPEIFAKELWTGKPYETRSWSGTCIDATSPAGEQFLRERFRRIYNWGFRYYKIDGLHTGAPSENVYIQRSYDGAPLYAQAELNDPSQTFVQCFRKGLTILKEEAPDVFVLGCSVTQNMSSMAPAFGLVHGMRVGPDNDKARVGQWENLTRGADYAGNLYFLNNRVWYNDPDPYYVRESNPLEKARWMVSWQSIAGVMSTTSIQYSELSPERLDLIKRGLPTHRYNARPVDILEHEKPQIWMVGNDRMNVIGLFNWEENDSTLINYSFERMGLEANREYELFDFWSNCYLGRMNGALRQQVEPAACKVLAVRPVQGYPQVISTSRHLTQGLIDVESEEWDSRKRVLSGRSKVVAGDSYELRIVVPEGWVVKKAVCEGKAMTVRQEGNLVRVAHLPRTTKSATWSLQF